MITVNHELLNALSGAVIPLLVAFVLHWSASPRIKAALNVALSFVAALLVVVTQHNGIVTKNLLVGFITTYVISGISHQHAWSPLGITNVINRIIPGFAEDAHVKKLRLQFEDYQKNAADIANAAKLAVRDMTPEQRAEASRALHKVIAGAQPTIDTYFGDGSGVADVVAEVGTVFDDPTVAADLVVQSDRAKVQAGFDKARDILKG